MQLICSPILNYPNNFVYSAEFARAPFIAQSVKMSVERYDCDSFLCIS